jgi:hypothetical protein
MGVRNGEHSTIRRRELGHELRSMITRAGLGVRQVAHRLDWDHPALSHILNGHRTASDTDVASVLALCQASKEKRDALLELCRDQKRLGWFQQHDGDRPTSSRTLADHERDATEITSLHLLTIPPLLRTESYARALASHAVTGTVGASESFVRACLRRQAVVNRDCPPKLTFFIGDVTVRHCVGDQQTMLQQMCQLIQMSTRLNVEIRIVPASAAPKFDHASTFTLIECADLGAIVHSDGVAYTLFLEKLAQIAIYQKLLSTADDVALSSEDSRQLISARATDLHSDTDACAFDTALCQ